MFMSSKHLAARAVAVVAAVLVTWAFASPASAHDPIFLTIDQVSPETGPYLPDGTISFAIYGSLYEAGETRGFEFDLRDGDDLYLSLLIPDLEPETGLGDGDLPQVTITGPDGEARSFSVDIREPFSDPFSGTDYVTLFEMEEPAVGGRHEVVVSGEGPSRFVVAVGTSEEFFTPIERAVDRPTSFPGIAEPLNEWYTTPADGSEPVNGNPAPGEGVDVDEELIEEELAKLDEQAEREDDTSDAADEAAEETDDLAAAVGTGDDIDEEAGSSTTWVAPTVAAIAAATAGAFALRRRQAAT